MATSFTSIASLPDGSYRWLTPDQRGYGDGVSKSAGALFDIINDILDFSKIEAGQLSIERIPFDLLAVLEDVADLAALRARQKGIDLVVSFAADVPHRVLGDPGRIRQILTNLVGKAVKFTASGHVQLGVRRDETNCGDTLSIYVEDTGIGIPEARQGLVFEKFRQADGSTTRSFGGTGLGRSINSQLCALT